MRLEPKAAPARHAGILATLGALAFTTVVAVLLLLCAHVEVGRAALLLARNAVGSPFALSETLTRATPLILCGLSVAVAFRCRLYNIGAEGQLYAGALAAVAVGFARTDGAAHLPYPVLFALMLAASMAAGAVLLLGPAWMRHRLGVDEVVTTLLLNFIALLAVSMLLDGPLKDPQSMGWPQSLPIDPSLELHRLGGRLRVSTGLLLALGAAALVHLLNERTLLGLEMRAVGANRRAAAFAGIPVGRVVFQTALLSGALAGLAGAAEVAGRASYVTLDMSPGYGYTGIVVAVLGNTRPLGVVLSALFFAAVQIGAQGMGRTLGVPTYLSDAVLATALLSMLAAQLLTRYRLRLS